MGNFRYNGKALREAKGIGAKELAERVGVHFSAVYDWERGKYYPTTDKLAVICKALGCELNDLFTDSIAQEGG